MKRCLVDVNVGLALLVQHHEHHRLVRPWFDDLSPGEAVLCRIAQLAMIRLLGTPAIMAEYALSASAAWTLIEQLLEDERFEFAREPDLLDTVLSNLFHYPGPTSRLITDAYLAAFAMAAEYRLVTLDSGFRQFKGLDVDLLLH